MINEGRHAARRLFAHALGDARLPGAEMSAHMPWLNLLARHWSFGRVVVECGVGKGYSTMSLLSGCVEAGGTLVSHDVAAGVAQTVLARLKEMFSEEAIRSWTFKLRESVKAASDFEDGSVGLFFLDTDHRYEQTCRELAAWLPKMAPDGVMCGHDYFLHLTPNWAKLAGVKKAVDEFAAKHKDTYELSVMPHDQGLWILWPRQA